MEDDRTQDCRIRTLEEICVYRDPNNPWVTLYFDRVAFPSGKVGRYNRIVEGSGSPGVVVVPVCEKAIGLVRQFRYPIGETAWEVPRGFGASNIPEDDARRELHEETRISDAKLHDLGLMHTNSGLSPGKVRVFVAVCAERGPHTQFHEGEIIEFAWFDVNRVERCILDQSITDMFTIAAFLKVRLQGWI